MKQYKDIINKSIVEKLKSNIHDACIIFNNLVRKDRIEKRESDLYEVYTTQYKEDLTSIQELRNRCLNIADECNRIMLDMNTHHIKQYYIHNSSEEINDDEW